MSFKCATQTDKHSGLLNIGCWDIRTLLDTGSGIRPARGTLATELNRYAMDIVSLSERRSADIGELVEGGEGFIFFWKGKAEEVAREDGVGFAIRSSHVLQWEEVHVCIIERIMTLMLSLNKDR